MQHFFQNLLSHQRNVSKITVHAIWTESTVEVICWCGYCTEDPYKYIQTCTVLGQLLFVQNHHNNRIITTESTQQNTQPKRKHRCPEIARPNSLTRHHRADWEKVQLVHNARRTLYRNTYFCSSASNVQSISFVFLNSPGCLPDKMSKVAPRMASRFGPQGRRSVRVLYEVSRSPYSANQNMCAMHTPGERPRPAVQ